MLFHDSSDIIKYGEAKYGIISGVVLELLCSPSTRHYLWNALAKGLGSGSNGVCVDVGIDIAEVYGDYDTPTHSYGFALFTMSWEDDMEERMPLPEFIEYLKDAHRVYTLMHPEEEANSKQDLDRAVAAMTDLQKEHEGWKRKNG